MRRVFAFVTSVMMVCAGAAFAQDAGSRAEEKAHQQQQKARSLSTYRPGFFERQILAIDKAGGFGVPRGFFITFGDIKPGSSVAVGPAYGKVLPSGTTLIGKVVYSVNNYKLAQFSAQSGPLLSNRLVIRSRVRWQDAPSVRLFALGTDSSKARTNYAETKREVSAQATLRPVSLLRFDGGLSFEKYTTGRSHSTDPLEPLLLVPGMGSDPAYLHSHASAAIDSRDGDGYSRHGSLLRGTAHDYRDRDGGTFTFQRFDGDAEQYVPILHGNWVIFLGLHASTTTASDGRTVPFFLLPELGGHDLRGFSNDRFRDRHSIYMTAEYRWYAQEFLDAAIYFDAGKVVPDRASIDFSHLKHSVGAGVRFHGPQTTALRLEVAKSKEGMRLILAFSPVGR